MISLTNHPVLLSGNNYSSSFVSGSKDDGHSATTGDTGGVPISSCMDTTLGTSEKVGPKWENGLDEPIDGPTNGSIIVPLGCTK